MRNQTLETRRKGVTGGMERGLFNPPLPQFLCVSRVLCPLWTGQGADNQAEQESDRIICYPIATKPLKCRHWPLCSRIKACNV
jgi:hypothetical protein